MHRKKPTTSQPPTASNQLPTAEGCLSVVWAVLKLDGAKLGMPGAMGARLEGEAGMH